MILLINKSEASFFKILICSLFLFSAPQLLAKIPLENFYEVLYPFHETLLDFKTVENCNENEGSCYSTEEFLVTPERFNKLLDATEKNHDVSSPTFLQSSLGRHYRALKNFMEILNNFNSCQEQIPFGTQENIAEQLNRLSDNASSYALNDPCFHENILSSDQMGFFNGVIENQIKNSIILDSLERSIEANLFHREGGNISKEELLNDFCTREDERSLWNKIYSAAMPIWARPKVLATGNLCNHEDKNLLRTLIDRVMKDKLKPEPIDTERVSRNLNNRIQQINNILKNYNQKKAELENEWQEEHKNKIGFCEVTNYGFKPSSSKKCMEKGIGNDLKSLKKEAFYQYRELYANLLQDGMGHLLQTEAIKELTGLDKLERVKFAGFGLLGVQNAALNELDEFTLLEPIDSATVQASVDEVISRTRDQVQELINLRHTSNNENNERKTKDDLEYLLQTNPASAGQVLVNNPGAAHTFCEIVKNIAVKDRNHEYLETATYIGLGVGMTAAFALSAGGVLPVTASITALVAGAAYTVGDSVYLTSQSIKHKRMQRAMLNAFLSGNRDEQSANQIREEEREVLENDHNFWLSLIFGLVDITGIQAATRAGSVMRNLKNMNNFKPTTRENQRLIKLIFGNNEYVKTLQNLQLKYPLGDVEKILTLIAKAPIQKQKNLLNALSQSSENLFSFAQSTVAKNSFTDDQLRFLQNLSGSPSNRASLFNFPAIQKRFLQDIHYKPLLKNLSTEEQNIVGEFILKMELEGKDKNQIIIKIREAINICSGRG